jgi:hypothetical protein
MINAHEYKCFVVQPNRYFKSLKEQINNDTFYVHGGGWKLKDESQYNSSNNLWRLPPFTYKLIKKNQTIIGVFPPDRFDYLKNVKKYTIIENPVDRVYQCFWYMQHQIGSKKLNKCDKIYEEYNGDLDSFIDMYIKNPDNVTLTAHCKNVIYETQYDALNQFKDLSQFQFVGTVEKLKKSIDIVNAGFNLNLIYDEKMKAKKLDCFNHRRDELEKVLSHQLESYHFYNDNID